MPRFRALAALFIILALTGFIGAGSNSDVVVLPGERNVFPTVSGINLLGETVGLPDSFEGQLNLVVLGFEMEQQREIDTWIAAYENLQSSLPAVRFYEVPVINSGTAAFRLWVNNGIRFGIMDQEARKRTITLYVDRSKFNAAVGIEGVDRIHALLVNGAGHILWRTEGPVSNDSIAELTAIAKDALSASHPWADR